jgi:hypothetical protein
MPSGAFGRLPLASWAIEVLSGSGTAMTAPFLGEVLPPETEIGRRGRHGLSLALSLL